MAWHFVWYPSTFPTRILSEKQLVAEFSEFLKNSAKQLAMPIVNYLVIKFNIFICDSKIFLTTTNITKASNSYNQITMNGDFSEFGKTKYFSIFV